MRWWWTSAGDSSVPTLLSTGGASVKKSEQHQVPWSSAHGQSYLDHPHTLSGQKGKTPALQVGLGSLLRTSKAC